MKVLYIMAALMLVGLLIMVVASQKVLSGVEISKEDNHATLAPELRPYIGISYMGVGLFVVGAVGAVIFLLKTINRRF